MAAAAVNHLPPSSNSHREGALFQLFSPAFLHGMQQAQAEGEEEGKRHRREPVE